MIFNEIYSAYYNTVAKIIARIIDGNADWAELEEIVLNNAFGESMLTVVPSLKSEKWQLITSKLKTPIKQKPTMPLTLMQKRWLKAISLDPRIKLFGFQPDSLGDIEPLFTVDDYVVYDKFSLGDPYGEPTYQKHFSVILSALKSGQSLKIGHLGRKGTKIFSICSPLKLEYSEKEDKFRLIARGKRFVRVIDIAHITDCEYLSEKIEFDGKPHAKLYETVTLKVCDERNALERCLMHFAHLEKRVEREENHYLLHIKFLREDQNEMLTRVLSFGPMVEVIGPESFKELIIIHLKKQKSCGL